MLVVVLPRFSDSISFSPSPILDEKGWGQRWFRHDPSKRADTSRRLQCWCLLISYLFQSIYRIIFSRDSTRFNSVYCSWSFFIQRKQHVWRYDKRVVIKINRSSEYRRIIIAIKFMEKQIDRRMMIGTIREIWKKRKKKLSKNKRWWSKNGMKNWSFKNPEEGW